LVRRRTSTKVRRRAVAHIERLRRGQIPLPTPNDSIPTEEVVAA
jgi:hypothetical protein